MLYDAVVLGSQLFHNNEPPASPYETYFRDYPSPLVNEPESVDLKRAKRLIQFVNEWKTRYQSSAEQLLEALQQSLPDVATLRHESLIQADLNATGSSIERIFDAVAGCGRRYESTGASKILHLIHPLLFVMWDNAIGSGYASGVHDAGQYRRTAQEYAKRFLPRVQRLLRRAIEEYRSTHNASVDEASQALGACGHTLAKVIDEYNYMKLTLRREEVWAEEYTPAR